MTDEYIKNVKDLPVVPQVATKILSMATDGMQVSFRDLENIIKIDPGLTARILKIANSALYARQKEIRNLQMAISLLGLKNLKNVVLLVTASNLFSQVKKTAFYPHFWKHSIRTGFLARHMCIRCGKEHLKEEVFLSGTLHDIGQLLLFNDYRDEYLAVIEDEKRGIAPIEELEEQKYGTNHRKIGGMLMGYWNFPEIFVDTAREHSSLNIISQYKNVIIFVSLADLLADKLTIGTDIPYKTELFNQLLPHSCLQPEDIAFYEQEFLAEMLQDPLFQQFTELFGIS